MAIPDSLLDTSWSIQYVPSVEPLPTLFGLLARPLSSASSRRMQGLSDDYREYLTSRGPAYKDELNDETEKTGQLRECTVDYMKVYDTDAVLGMSIEAHYQKTTYRVVLVANQNLDANVCPVSTILYKASQSHLKSIKGWLNEKFGLPWALPLHSSPQLLPKLCSRFLMSLDEDLAGANGGDALTQATLRQVIGTLKITFTFSNATGSGIAPHLRTMDFDIPAETVGVFLSKASVKGRTNRCGFLDEFAQALHEKTGLRLPLTDKTSNAETGDLSGESRASSQPLEQMEPPLKVTKIICAAFALRADGAVKLASKPIEDAEVIGYDGTMVRRRYIELLQTVFEEAERRQKDG